MNALMCHVKPQDLINGSKCGSVSLGLHRGYTRNSSSGAILGLMVLAVDTQSSSRASHEHKIQHRLFATIRSRGRHSKRALIMLMMVLILTMKKNRNNDKIIRITIWTVMVKLAIVSSNNCADINRGTNSKHRALEAESWTTSSTLLVECYNILCPDFNSLPPAIAVYLEPKTPNNLKCRSIQHRCYSQSERRPPRRLQWLLGCACARRQMAPIGSPEPWRSNSSEVGAVVDRSDLHQHSKRHLDSIKAVVILVFTTLSVSQV